MDKSEECIEILLDVAILSDYTWGEFYSRKILERLYKSAYWLNKHAKEEATSYAKKEHGISQSGKRYFLSRGEAKMNTETQLSPMTEMTIQQFIGFYHATKGLSIESLV